MTCAMCPMALSPKQRRYCSRACQRSNAPTVFETRVLLEACRGQWLTISDIAIWVYGDDAPAECNAVRTTLDRLRQRGYVLESRIATWIGWTKGGALAYRLAAIAQEAVA